ncbi:iron uptake system component EfeO [Neomicrococcus aestuarii]|uniref:Iron uptake system component EfeO n=1 Tax=Neomicrococcus aestuarii TaxID=556325 RepID=A0A7W8TV12_9MICC|nr:iron uptake system protein EfeO [Neomicrococcus aestuarii]MBB5513401.1 iron uptake system component EfeO [Neomicrococcus aestuarii]
MKLIQRAVPLALIAGLGLTGCTSNAQPSSATGTEAGGPIAVSSTDTECTLTASETSSGTVTFNVKNDGTQVTEFYLIASDGNRIVGEVENIGPGLSRQLTVIAGPGSYTTQCKPGMVGDGITQDFTLTAGANGTVDANRVALQEDAVKQYQEFVAQEADALEAGTGEFAAAFAAGNVAEAKALYPAVRMHWERIEPVAESFGDLDPILDAREADLEEGQEFTGWHRVEKDLWVTDASYTKMTAAERQEIADGMVTNTKELVSRAKEIEFTVDALSNGSKGLLDEVATGKVTGEEEAFSHTDLWDFAANIEGAKTAFEDLKPLLKGTNDELSATLTKNFTELETLLAKYEKGDGYVLYTDLTEAQIQELSAAVDALGEPLSQLTSEVVK